MTAEHVPVIFRGQTPEEASTAAKAWARAEGLRVRTIATIRRREDFPVWTPEGPAWEVTLVLDLPDGGTLPEPPTLPLWGDAGVSEYQVTPWWAGLWPAGGDRA